MQYHTLSFLKEKKSIKFHINNLCSSELQGFFERDIENNFFYPFLNGMINAVYPKCIIYLLIWSNFLTLIPIV